MPPAPFVPARPTRAALPGLLLTAALGMVGGSPTSAAPPLSGPRLSQHRATACYRQHLRRFLRETPAERQRLRSLHRRLVRQASDPGEILEEGTSILFLLRDSEGRKLGVLKPSSGNTSCHGEVAFFRLALLLGVPDLVGLTVPYSYPSARLPALRARLSGKVFAGVKERSRRRLLAGIDARIGSGDSLPVAIGTWQPAMTYWRKAGNLQSRGYDPENPLARHLLAEEPQPPRSPFLVRQFSRLTSPLGLYTGSAPTHRLASELSTIMLLDALVANVDRFPGGNLHVRSRSGRARVLREAVRGKDGRVVTHARVDLGEVSFLALDNGATLRTVRPETSKAMRALREHVSRVDRSVASGILALHRFLQGEIPVFRDLRSTDELAWYLTLGSRQHPFWKALRRNVAALATWIRVLEETHGPGRCYFRRR